MAKKAWEIEINEDTPRAELELYLIEATRTSDLHAQNVAAQARAEIWLRDRKEQRELFNAESTERVKEQEFQAAQFSNELDVANQQARAAGRAMMAAWASAIAAIALVIVAVIQLLTTK